MDLPHTILIPKKAQTLIGVLRIFLGWLFLWAFVDKLFGLGFATTVAKSWLNGASPTAGFLQFAIKGPFETIFSALTGYAIIDWLFMLGLLGIGVALMLGVCMKIASHSASVLLLLMYLAVLPAEHNPLIDDHIIYIVTIQLLLLLNAGNYLGLSKWWSSVSLVKKHTWLK